MKLLYIVGIVISVIILAITGPGNIKNRNLGLDGGLNAFFAGGIMNIILVGLICFALIMFLRKKNVKVPQELTPINDG